MLEGQMDWAKQIYNQSPGIVFPPEVCPQNDFTHGIIHLYTTSQHSSYSTFLRIPHLTNPCSLSRYVLIVVPILNYLPTNTHPKLKHPAAWDLHHY
ncbi:hypothetical protein ACRALDRAFT_1091217 [Sodiomyces alcalophilus JCM 7366]|uniref:uncharacterized protein n=1 Tax=Sodiomyces alcalophilus JCM 7366 TaxID=591952 RepID=UPI0039B5EEF3